MINYLPGHYAYRVVYLEGSKAEPSGTFSTYFEALSAVQDKYPDAILTGPQFGKFTAQEFYAGRMRVGWIEEQYQSTN